MSVLASDPPLAPLGFFCSGCFETRGDDFSHPSGYCRICIGRGRRFWQRALSAREIDEIAGMIWGGEADFGRLAA